MTYRLTKPCYAVAAAKDLVGVPVKALFAGWQGQRVGLRSSATDAKVVRGMVTWSRIDATKTQLGPALATARPRPAGQKMEEYEPLRVAAPFFAGGRRGGGCLTGWLAAAINVVNAHGDNRIDYRHASIGLLPDRTGDTFAARLQAHPCVQIRLPDGEAATPMAPIVVLHKRRSAGR